MPDDIDAAQAAEDAARERAITAIRRKLLPEENAGLEDCEDCGDPIGEGRRLAVPSAKRCTICQNIHDNKYGRGR